MPLIVDKEAMREKILSAFEACLEEKPMDSVSLRDIAARAGMTHPKLLHYFRNREELVLAYCEYARRYMAEHCQAWFRAHQAGEYATPLQCMNAFMQYVAEGGTTENRPRATMQTYVLAKYNGEIQRMVAEEFASWRITMLTCLKGIYGDQVDMAQAEAMMILITGTFVCNYTGALTGNINGSILSAFQPLIEGKPPVHQMSLENG